MTEQQMLNRIAELEKELEIATEEKDDAKLEEAFAQSELESAKEDLVNAEDDLRFALELITDRLQDIKSKDAISRDDIAQLIIDIQRGVMFEESGIIV